MSDAAMLLKAVVADPGDGLARLALADALDETGDEDDRLRALSIRGELTVRNPLWIASLWSHLLPMRRDFSLCVNDAWDASANANIVFIRNGFVDEIQGSLALLRKYLPDIVGVEPVRRVVVADVEPTRVVDERLRPLWYWGRQGSIVTEMNHLLPDSVWGRLTGYVKKKYSPDRYKRYWHRGEATDALSAAVLADARATLAYRTAQKNGPTGVTL